MKPLSVEIACILGIQNKMQAVWVDIVDLSDLPDLLEVRRPAGPPEVKNNWIVDFATSIESICLFFIYIPQIKCQNCL